VFTPAPALTPALTPTDRASAPIAAASDSAAAAAVIINAFHHIAHLLYFPNDNEDQRALFQS
jgi:hypothetical protein